MYTGPRLETTRRLLLRPAAGLVLLALGACATLAGHDAPAARPPFRLAPATLGMQLALQQQLTVTVLGQRQPPLQALIEVDETHVAIAVLGAGQTLTRINWDGQRLQAEQPEAWPRSVSAERLLSDLQLAFWPLAALQAALPPGWTLTDHDGQRLLSRGGETVATVMGARSAHVEIASLLYHYRLVIDSVALEGGTLPVQAEEIR
jgi:hypothetical protein